ncbi:unnamed protein product [Gordionus sp. m RMFG-2023]
MSDNLQDEMQRFEQELHFAMGTMQPQYPAFPGPIGGHQSFNETANADNFLRKQQPIVNEYITKANNVTKFIPPQLKNKLPQLNAPFRPLHPPNIPFFNQHQNQFQMNPSLQHLPNLNRYINPYVNMNFPPPALPPVENDKVTSSEVVEQESKVILAAPSVKYDIPKAENRSSIGLLLPKSLSKSNPVAYSLVTKMSKPFPTSTTSIYHSSLPTSTKENIVIKPMNVSSVRGNLDSNIKNASSAKLGEFKPVIPSNEKERDNNNITNIVNSSTKKKEDSNKDTGEKKKKKKGKKKRAVRSLAGTSSTYRAEQPKKSKIVVRYSAGACWMDASLLDWDPNDYRIFCGDLGNEVTDEVLARAFNKYPSFQRSKVIRDKRNNKTKGFGFVSFKDALDYAKAMKEMNGKYVGGRPVKLRKSCWRERNLDIVRKKNKEKQKLVNQIRAL